MNTLVVCPSFFQAPWCQKEDHTPYSQRLQSIKEIMHRSRVRKRAGEEHHGSKLAAGIQKGKADQIVLNGGSELGLSQEQSVGLELQKEGRSTFWDWARSRWDKTAYTKALSVVDLGIFAWVWKPWTEAITGFASSTAVTLAKSFLSPNQCRYAGYNKRTLCIHSFQDINTTKPSNATRKLKTAAWCWNTFVLLWNSTNSSA